MGVFGVLPLWLDVILEEVECGSGLELARGSDVVIKGPEILNSVKRVDASERLPELAESLLCLHEKELLDA